MSGVMISKGTTHTTSFVPEEKGEPMRLIDADAVKLPEGFFEKVDNVPKFYDWLNSLPTIDAVEVVRCRDCKWWNGYYRECESPNWNTGTDEYIVQPAGMFCGWGERKSEDPSHPCADSVMMGD